jgi:hypothetical protein
MVGSLGKAIVEKLLFLKAIVEKLLFLKAIVSV